MGLLSWFRRSAASEAPNQRAVQGDSGSTYWDAFYEAAQVDESLKASVRDFVGPWPSEVDPTVFGGDVGAELASKLHAFITGPYPGRSADSYPEYQARNGKIARASNQFLDMMLCMVIPRNQLASSQPHVAVWKLIERYSNLPLSKLLFTLPQIHMLSKAKRGETVIWVVRDGEAEAIRHLSTDQVLRIQVYKGVENAIFSAYHDLPEGGYLSDEIIEKKIRSLLNR